MNGDNGVEDFNFEGEYLIIHWFILANGSCGYLDTILAKITLIKPVYGAAFVCTCPLS